jgi:hypothetical protein
MVMNKVTKSYGVAELVKLFALIIKPITDAIRDEMAPRKKAVALEPVKLEVTATVAVEVKTFKPVPLTVLPCFPLTLLPISLVAPSCPEVVPVKAKGQKKAKKATAKPLTMRSAAQVTKKPVRWTVKKVGAEWTITNGEQTMKVKTRDEGRKLCKTKNG